MLFKIVYKIPIFLFIIIFAIITYQNSLILEYSLLQLRTIDDIALLESYIQIKKYIYDKNYKYIFSFIGYAYGFLFWILNTILLTPLTLLNHEGLVIFAARQISTIFAFGCLYILIEISKYFGANKHTANIIGLFFIFTPNFFLWSFKFHVNYISVFFILLSLLILLKSKDFFFKNIIYSAIFIGVGAGLKLTGILLYPFAIITLIYKMYYLKVNNKIYIFCIYNLIFLISLILSFCPALFLGFFNLDAAKKIFDLVILFKNMGSFTNYFDPILLFKQSIKYYYEGIVFTIILLFGIAWSWIEYSRNKNVLPFLLFIYILFAIFFVTIYLNKPSLYVSSYAIVAFSLLPIFLCVIDVFKKKFYKFFLLYSLLILHLYLNFDFLTIQAFKNYRLAKSIKYSHSKEILKDLELITNENLLKNNNKILLDVNAIFPIGLFNKRRVLSYMYLDPNSTIEVYKRRKTDFSYIVLNSENIKKKKTFDGYEIEYRNRRLLKENGYFDTNKNYRLVYNKYHIELYEKINLK